MVNGNIDFRASVAFLGGATSENPLDVMACEIPML
jgi:hypothetical protein